jgi:hypothetical protein
MVKNATASRRRHLLVDVAYMIEILLSSAEINQTAITVGRRTLCILLTPPSSSSDWLKDLSANEKAE